LAGNFTLLGPPIRPDSAFHFQFQFQFEFQFQFQFQFEFLFEIQHSSGRYCSTSGMTTVGGLCSIGYYCPAGSVNEFGSTLGRVIIMNHVDFA
jgi:hypothetical protein